ncbi:MAG: arginine--tRNA ligase [Alphaproteobacteria bacterium]|nr:arginine--tRNA ligase [Alphaproteobacteria bacterium]
MTIFATIEGVIYQHLEAMKAAGDLPAELDFSAISLEIPTDPKHGDIATNAAMVLAKIAKQNPRALAEKLAEKLAQEAVIEKIEIAGPGFINLTLQADIWRAELPYILKAGTEYGICEIGKGQKVNVEYVSANPTGPLHVGHARGAVFGDALANLLERAGYEVTREYYINDAGKQVNELAHSILVSTQDALGMKLSSKLDEQYAGDYLKPISTALVEKHGTGLFEQTDAEQVQAAIDIALPIFMTQIKEDLAALGVKHNVFSSEKNLHDKDMIMEAIKPLEAKGLVYEGILDPPKDETHKQDETQTQDNGLQLIFKSSQFGDDSDRVLQRAGGEWTYFAADIAYHWDKIQRGFTELINVWGSDHIGYIKRLKSAVAALTDDKVQLDIKICQLVHFMRNKEKVKMSKRSGNFVTLRQVVDEVGKDVVRFIMLTRKNDAHLDFDFAAVVEKTRDNPVFYVQYAHARICSVLRQAPTMASISKAELSDSALAKADLALLKAPAELALIRRLAAFPRVVERAAITHEPHRIAFFLSAVAADFHHLWQAGKLDEELKFVQKDNKNVSLARLALIRATAIILVCGFDILGVTPQETL